MKFIPTALILYPNMVRDNMSHIVIAMCEKIDIIKPRCNLVLGTI